MQKIARDAEDYETQATEVYYALGRSYLAFEEIESALQCFKRLLAIRSRLHGTGSHTLFSVYHQVGMCFFKTGDFQSAVHSLEIALAIWNSYGTDKDIWKSLENEALRVYSLLGVCFDGTETREAARHYLKLSVKMSGEALRGEQHKHAADSCCNIARFYVKCGAERKAIVYLKLALAHLKIYFGDENLSVAAGYQYVGSLYEVRQLYEKAARYYEAALGAFARLYGERNARCVFLKTSIDECNAKANTLWNRVRSAASVITVRSKKSLMSAANLDDKKSSAMLI